MLEFFLFILGLAACMAETDVRKIKIEYEDGVQNLDPSMGPSDTLWGLKTCPNCKLVLSCLLQDENCKGVNVTIWNGIKFKDGCKNNKKLVFLNSHKNELILRITTTEATLPAVCQVTATKPYIDLSEEEIDSSEDGLETEKVDCRCGWSNKEGGQRIVGGRETKVNEYPFPVLFLVNFAPICGGSIVTPWHVITAAHCTYSNKDERMSIAAGEHDINTYRDTKATQVVQVQEVIEHPDFNPRNLRNDIAILFLKDELRFNDRVGPVCMPESIRDLVSEHVKVLGWGNTANKGDSSDILMKANLKIIDPDICKVIYNTDPINKTQICTYATGKDSCQGDSGGPVVWLNERNKFTQVGIVSFGRSCASTNPGVNINVAAYMDWIKGEISRTKPQRICY